MTPIFIDSASVNAPERFVVRGGGWRSVALRVRYAVVLDDPNGPTLIDTGYTERVTRGPDRSHVLRLYARALRPRLHAAGQPVAALRTLGLEPHDIRRVIVTHFHADHVAGLHLFANARFHASGAAWSRIANATPRARLRHGVFAELFPPDFGDRLDPIEVGRNVPTKEFGTGYDLSEDGSIVAVPLPGHADGQFGMLFPKLDPPLLYAVDAQWCVPALDPTRMPGLPASLVADDRSATTRTTERIAAFRDRGGQVVLCHDPAPTSFDLASDAR